MRLLLTFMFGLLIQITSPPIYANTVSIANNENIKFKNLLVLAVKTIIHYLTIRLSLNSK